MFENFYKNMSWVQISFILCAFGLFKEFRPGEPFVTDYLTGKWKNFTVEQVMQEIYPVGTYSYLAMLVLVFLLTDFLRYKPVIILCGLSGTATYIMIVSATSIPAFQFLEFTYGIFFSTEVAYYTYIYAKVDKQHYQAVSSYTRGAYLVGKFLSGVVGQCAATFDIMDYHELNYLTILGVGLATVCACMLPPVGRSLYFHRSDSSYEADNQQIRNRLPTPLGLDCQSKASQQTLQTHVHHPKSSFATKVTRAYGYLWQDFLRAYTNGHVVKWSLWWAFATAGYLQVASYVQPLWQTAVAKDAKIYNGAVEATYTIIVKRKVSLEAEMISTSGETLLLIVYARICEKNSLQFVLSTVVLQILVIMINSMCITVFLLSTVLLHILLNMINSMCITVVGALAVFGVGKLRLNWPVLGEGILSIFSILEAFILFICSQSHNIWLQYTVYIMFGVIYHTIITVASFEVAKNLADDSYALVFGLNTLLALAIQSLLTFIVVSSSGLALEIRPQFQVYAGYFMVLGVVFLVMAVYTAIRFFRSGEEFKLWLKKEIVPVDIEDESSITLRKDQSPS